MHLGKPFIFIPPLISFLLEGGRENNPFLNKKPYTTFGNGYLGSCIDEDRSEMRYVVRIADLCESSNR